jgi:hypothetical protein
MLHKVEAKWTAAMFNGWIAEERSQMTNKQLLSFRRFASTSILCAPLLWGACGRTPLLPPSCTIEVDASGLDLGDVPPGGQATRTLAIANLGGAECHISGLGLSPSSDPWFTVGPPGSTAFVVRPGERSTVAVAFNPETASVPLDRAGTLVFDSDDPSRGRVDVPVTARILTNCTLAVAPNAVDFGHVVLDSSMTRSVDIVNVGEGTCEIGGVALAKGSDAQFSLAPGQTDTFTLAPGESQAIAIVFHAVDPAAPHRRSGQLTFETTDAKAATRVVQLSANIDVGCSLTISPASLDFGNVMLNTTAFATVTLGNDGSDTCHVSDIAFGLGTDSGFTLDAGQALAFNVDPGVTRSIAVAFGAFDSAPPHLKTGTLVLKTGNARMPVASVPLSAYVNSVCVEASQWIYTVDQSSRFSRFDPATATFTDIGLLDCADSSGPFSMAVDQNAMAWVLYMDGNLFKVDTANGQCKATSFQVGQHGLYNFGMGFVFEPSTGVDTLYIAGGGSNWFDNYSTQSELATVSFPSLVVTPVGTTNGEPELSGTGDGTLWGFFPGSYSPTGLSSLVRIDPANGATLESYSYKSIPTYGNWAMKFWGGSFWIFLGNSIYRVDRATPTTIHTVTADSGYAVVGAGVSTCAPLH